MQAKHPVDTFIGGPGILIDFKELKVLVQEGVINTLDHKLILSKAYLSATESQFSSDELVVFDVEPSAENLLLFLSKQISSILPETVRLQSLKLWETRDSYAEWLA